MSNRNPNISSLDPLQMLKQTLDGEMDAQRVIIVGGMSNNSLPINNQELKVIEVEKPVIVDRVEYREVEKPVIITELKEVEKQVVVKEYVPQEKVVEKIVFVDKIQVVEIEKPVIIEKEKILSNSKLEKIVILLLSLQIIVTVLSKLI